MDGTEEEDVDWTDIRDSDSWLLARPFDQMVN